MPGVSRPWDGRGFARARSRGCGGEHLLELEVGHQVVVVGQFAGDVLVSPGPVRNSRSRASLCRPVLPRAPSRLTCASMGVGFCRADAQMGQPCRSRVSRRRCWWPPDERRSVEPCRWAAAAAWATVAAAVVAIGVAWRQLGESRHLRREQAKPYVVAFMEPSPASPQIIKLVVRNFGNTTAHDVRVAITPPPKRTDGRNGIEAVWLPKEIAMLVPGQAWETFWDYGPDRDDEPRLPDRHEARITCVDLLAPGEPREESRASLDWGQYKGRRWETIYSVHDGVKALREIRDSVKRWGEFQGGLSVWARDGDAKDTARHDRVRERRAAHEDRVSRLKPGPEVPGADEDGNLDGTTAAE